MQIIRMRTEIKILSIQALKRMKSRGKIDVPEDKYKSEM